MQQGHYVEQSLIIFYDHQSPGPNDDMLPTADENSPSTAQFDRERYKRRCADKLLQVLKHARLSLFETESTTAKTHPRHVTLTRLAR